MFFHFGYSYPGEIGASGRRRGKETFLPTCYQLLVTGFMDGFMRWLDTLIVRWNRFLKPFQSPVLSVTVDFLLSFLDAPRYRTALFVASHHSAISCWLKCILELHSAFIVH